MADSSHGLDTANEQWRMGRHAEAEETCSQVLKTDPSNAEAHYLFGLIAFERQSFDLAEKHMARAVALIPADPGFHCGLGNVQYMQSKLDEAAESFQKAIDLNPEIPQAHANLGLILTDAGRSQEAIPVLQKALSLDPQNAEVLLSLGNAFQEQQQYEEAINSYNRVIQISPEYAAAYNNLGNAYSIVGELDKAEEAYRNCLRLDPEFKDVFTNLGLTLVSNGKLEEAAKHFIDAVRAFRAVEERPLGMFMEFNKYNKTKLQHDSEQLDHLMNQNKISKDFEELAQEYRDILSRLGDRYEGMLSELDPPASSRLLKSYNRIVHHDPGTQIEGGVLSPDLDLVKIEKDFIDDPYGFTYFDGLLREEALQSLRAFCLDSTIWSLIEYEDEIESNLLTGFSCPLIFQIATEIKLAFPKIFGPYPFTSCWAYKYFEKKSGLGVHCDDGTVSINFWITPDQANNNPETGGLVLWNKRVSRDFLGKVTEQRLEQFNQVISEPDAQSFRVPYRCNRAVLFHSNVLHGTDEIDFKAGYENNRINMTFLYGKSPKKSDL